MHYTDQIEELNITRKSPTGYESTADQLIVEEPLEILIQAAEELKATKVCTTMRTPGDDHSLTLGFLFCEGILKSKDDIDSIESISDNQVLVKFKESLPTELKKLNRHFHSTSSCGICGVDSIDHLYEILPPQSSSNINPIKHNVILRLKSIMDESSAVFRQTGGNHIAALFDSKGQIISFKEDVGRHNALDKLIGNSIYKGVLPLSQRLLLLSGRVSFELMQKALMADIQYIIAIGAPTNLAVKLAIEHDITLIGFLKDKTYNVYHGKENIELS